MDAAAPMNAAARSNRTFMELKSLTDGRPYALRLF